MANEKNINSRIQLKHDVEANWYAAGTAANPFIPKAGEVIIYDPDDVYKNVRTKVGDGFTEVHLLPWATGCDESVGLEFELINDDKEYSVKGIGVCVDTELVIPKGYQGKPVTYICDYAFSACDVFSSVVIPDSVTTIGVQAFGECDYLSSIVIPNSVTSIGDYAFYSCYELTSIVIPDSVTTICNAAFSYCSSLTSVVIGDSVTTIGNSAFYECSGLTSVVIPDSVTSIGEAAFYCSKLKNVYYTGDEIQWANIEISSGNEPLINATIYYNYFDDFQTLNNKLGDTTALKTVSKEIVGAINELNDKSIDKIGDLYPATGGVEHVSKTEYGIQFDNTYELFLKDETSADGTASEPYSSMYHTINIPIVAGDNVTFTIDEEKQVVKINATGGSETFDKIQNIYDMESTIEIDPEEGVYEWSDRYFTDGEDGNILHISEATKIYPFVAGDNVTFTHDTENQVVKINAAGGEIDASKFVSKYTIETGASTTVLDVINAIQNAGGNIGEWNVIVLTGYITETWGLQISHHGSTVYSIQGVNLNNMKTVSNTASWSGVTLGSFQTMFKPAIPYCNSSNEDQFLRVVSGAPAWVAVPNAEEVSF